MKQEDWTVYIVCRYKEKSKTDIPIFLQKTGELEKDIKVPFLWDQSLLVHNADTALIKSGITES